MKYPLFLKKIVHNTRYFIKRKFSDNYLQLDWSPTYNNFGDILNPILAGSITSKKIINVSARYCKSEHLMAIGSILGRANKESIVWGSGFISSASRCKEKPKKILAVRGPLTKKLLEEQGIECPSVFGDPALLLPRFYKVQKTKKYKLGVLPHYKDKDAKWLKTLGDDVKVIDIQNPNPLEVVDQICECQYIASSSLHGIIISDAYKVPSVWIQLSDKIVGGKFKFHDYLESIQSELVNPVIVNSDLFSESLIDKCKVRPIKVDLDLLLDSFPQKYK